MMWAFAPALMWSDERGTNMLDTGARTTTPQMRGRTIRRGRDRAAILSRNCSKLGLDPAALPIRTTARWLGFVSGWQPPSLRRP